MNIGELITTLGVDSTQLDQADKKMRDFGQKAAANANAVNKVYEKQTGLIEDLQSHIKDLEVAKMRANSTKDIARYNGYLEESKKKLKDLENAGISAGETQSSAIQKWIIRMASFTGAIYLAKKGWELYKTVVNSAGGTQDRFLETMTAIELTTDRFFNILATGEFDNFVKKLQDAAKAGQEYAAALDQIKERTMGSTLEKAYISPEQMARQTIFRDPNENPLLRQQKINEYKKEAIRLATQDFAISQAAVIAEEDKLKGIGIEAEKIKQLYLTYNSGIIDIKKAEEARARIAEINNEKQIIASQQGAFNEKFKTETLAKLQTKQDTYYNSLTEGEKLYVDLLNENAKVKESNVVSYLTALENEKSKEAEIAAVTKDVVRVQSQITNAIDLQNEKLKKQIALYDTNPFFTFEPLVSPVPEDTTMKDFYASTAQMQKDQQDSIEGFYMTDAELAKKKWDQEMAYNRLDMENWESNMKRKQELTQELTNVLADSFMGFFESAEKGWQGMLDTFSQAINRFLAEQAAKALLKFVMNLIAPGSGTAFNAISNVIPSGVSSSSNVIGSLGSLSNKANIDIGGQFEIKGKDLVRVIQRNS